MKRNRTWMPAFAGMTISLFLQVRGLNHRRERPELKTERNDRNGFMAVHCGRCNRLGCNGNRERFLAALEMTAAIQVLWVSSRTQVRDLSRTSSVVDRWASNVAVSRCRIRPRLPCAPRRFPLRSNRRWISESRRCVHPARARVSLRWASRTI